MAFRLKIGCQTDDVRDFEAVKAAEVALLTSAIRRDPGRVRDLLHEDFVEIGRSGRLWTRDEILTSLSAEDDRPDPETDEWAFVEVADGLVLLTYRVRRESGESRHSSIWDLRSGDPKLRFHQGTVVPGE